MSVRVFYLSRCVWMPLLSPHVVVELLRIRSWEVGRCGAWQSFVVRTRECCLSHARPAAYVAERPCCSTTPRDTPQHGPRDTHPPRTETLYCKLLFYSKQCLEFFPMTHLSVLPVSRYQSISSDTVASVMGPYKNSLQYVVSQERLLGQSALPITVVEIRGRRCALLPPTPQLRLFLTNQLTHTIEVSKLYCGGSLYKLSS